MGDHDAPPPSPPPDSPEHHHDAIEEARDLVDHAVGQVRDLGSFIASLHSRYLTGLLAIYAATAAGGTVIVAAHPFRDWYMFLAMWLVIFAFVLLYVKAHYRRTALARGATLLFTLALMTGWAAVLYDRIPEARVWFRNEVVVKPELPILWAPIGGLAVVAAGLILHWAWIGRHHWKAKGGPVP